MSDQPNNLVNLTIDGQAISVPKGTTVFTASKQLGIDLPIFCYHDRMPPFGACRVCMVEVEKMPRPQTSCTLEAAEGMMVKTRSQLAVEGREGILEFLLINHPLDCPICDRGGECPLQEHVFAHGPGESRFFEEKRHFTKAWPLGPVLMLDRERCIQCARCTRFGDVIAGDHALEFKDRGFRMEVGTPDDGPAESKFIGNTIMICPVGALTSQVYRFRARPWDNTSTQSTCTLCPVGCSLSLDSRDGEIMRTRSRENKDVNDIWLCDKGWFGYEFTYSPERLQQPLIRQNGKLQPATWDAALSLIVSNMQQAKTTQKAAAFGGNPLTVEENFLFQRLIQEGTGTHNVDYRIGMPIFNLDEEGISPGMAMSIGECESLSFAILLGVDLTEEFPVIWLRLRQAINKGAKIIYMGHYAPETSSYYTKTIIHAPGNEVDTLNRQLASIQTLIDSGKQGAIFVGSQYLASPNRLDILNALTNLKKSNTALNLLEGKGNSIGARFAGMHPELGPFGERLAKPGLNAIQVLEKATKDGWDFLYVAGANPATRFPSKFWDEARQQTKFLVVQDLFLTETAQQADVVLPTLSYIEKGGHFVNIEGRVQGLLPGKEIPEGIYSDGEIFSMLAQKLNVQLNLNRDFLPKLQTDKVPLNQAKTVHSSKSAQLQEATLRATFAPVLFDRGVRMQHDEHLVKMSKDPYVSLNPHEGTTRRLQDDDLIRVTANDCSISALVKLDEKVALGTVVLPLGFTEIPVHELAANLLNGLSIDIQKEEPSC